MLKNISITEVVDWKDVDGLIESFRESLKELGIVMVSNPVWEGTDEYSFVLSKEDVTLDEVRKCFSESHYDEDGESSLITYTRIKTYA